MQRSDQEGVFPIHDLNGEVIKETKRFKSDTFTILKKSYSYRI